MSPQPRRAWPAGAPPDSIRDAAGLLLVFPDAADRPHIVLTVRADTLGRHGGQVSLPGGVIEPGESYAHAALREAHEEIALDARLVRVIGALTPVDIPVSGFRLHPIVGLSDAASRARAGRRRSRQNSRHRDRRSRRARLRGRGDARARGAAD